MSREDPLFLCDDPRRLRRAIDRYTQGKADFSDCLVTEVAADAGASAGADGP